MFVPAEVVVEWARRIELLILKYDKADEWRFNEPAFYVLLTDYCEKVGGSLRGISGGNRGDEGVLSELHSHIRDLKVQIAMSHPLSKLRVQMGKISGCLKNIRARTELGMDVVI